jgi:hypothetical protein
MYALGAGEVLRAYGWTNVLTVGVHCHLAEFNFIVKW